MKKAVLIILTVFLFTAFSFSAFAGSIPEDLLNYDGAKVFFAQVIDKKSDQMTISPVKKIKGDVEIDKEFIAKNISPIGDIKEGNVYLFTYFDENNPYYVFEATSYDTKTLKLKNIEGDMWQRFEKYLNQGKYEEAESSRLGGTNKEISTQSENLPQLKQNNTLKYVSRGSLVAFVTGVVSIIIRKKKRK